MSGDSIIKPKYPTLFALIKAVNSRAEPNDFAVYLDSDCVEASRSSGEILWFMAGAPEAGLDKSLRTMGLEVVILK